MTQHTKGPWIATENGKFFTGGGTFLIANTEFQRVAECQVPIHNIPWTIETAKANVRLIAATPELLEDLKKANQKLMDINNMFYGQNLGVANWHRNGTLQSMDSFFEENDWEPEEMAIKKVKGKE